MNGQKVKIPSEILEEIYNRLCETNAEIDEENRLIQKAINMKNPFYRFFHNSEETRYSPQTEKTNKEDFIFCYNLSEHEWNYKNKEDVLADNRKKYHIYFPLNITDTKTKQEVLNYINEIITEKIYYDIQLTSQDVYTKLSRLRSSLYSKFSKLQSLETYTRDNLRELYSIQEQILKTSYIAKMFGMEASSVPQVSDIKRFLDNTVVKNQKDLIDECSQTISLEIQKCKQTATSCMKELELLPEKSGKGYNLNKIISESEEKYYKYIEIQKEINQLKEKINTVTEDKNMLNGFSLNCTLVALEGFSDSIEKIKTTISEVQNMSNFRKECLEESTSLSM